MKIEFKNVEEVFDFIRKNNSYKMIIVNFFTEWCPSCRKMDFALNEFMDRNSGNFLLKIDSEKNSHISRDLFFNISLVPTTFFFKQGVLWKKLRGSMELNDLEVYLQKDN